MVAHVGELVDRVTPLKHSCCPHARSCNQFMHSYILVHKMSWKFNNEGYLHAFSCTQKSREKELTNAHGDNTESAVPAPALHFIQKSCDAPGTWPTEEQSPHLEDMLWWSVAGTNRQQCYFHWHLHILKPEWRSPIQVFDYLLHQEDVLGRLRLHSRLLLTCPVPACCSNTQTAKRRPIQEYRWHGYQPL